MRKDNMKSLAKQLKLQPNEKTSVEIRLFNWDTSGVFYRELTQKELTEILTTLGVMKWQ